MPRPGNLNQTEARRDRLDLLHVHRPEKKRARPVPSAHARRRRLILLLLLAAFSASATVLHREHHLERVQHHLP